MRFTVNGRKFKSLRSACNTLNLDYSYAQAYYNQSKNNVEACEYALTIKAFERLFPAPKSDAELMKIVKTIENTRYDLYDLSNEVFNKCNYGIVIDRNEWCNIVIDICIKLEKYKKDDIEKEFRKVCNFIPIKFVNLAVGIASRIELKDKNKKEEVKNMKKLILNGKKYASLKEACITLGLNYSTVYNFYRKNKEKGCTYEAAIDHYYQAKVKAAEVKEISTTKPEKLSDVSSKQKEVEIEETKIELKPTNKEVKEYNGYIPSILDKFDQVYDIIDSGYFTKINLIDFENVNNIIIINNVLDDPKTLNIMIFNKLVYTNTYFKVVKKCALNNKTAFGTMARGDQLIDHILVYFLGILNIKYPNIEFNIVSNDTGYNAFTKFLIDEGVKVSMTSLKVHTNNDKFAYALCKFIVENKKNNFAQYNIYSEKDLFTAFRSFFNKRFNTEDATKKIIDSLSVIGVITEADKINGIQYYYIDMIKAKELVEGKDE